MIGAPESVRWCGQRCGLPVRAQMALLRALAGLRPNAHTGARSGKNKTTTKRARAACNPRTARTARTAHMQRGSVPAIAARTTARTTAHSRARLTHLRDSRKKGWLWGFGVQRWCASNGNRIAAQQHFIHALQRRYGVDSARKRYQIGARVLGPHGVLYLGDIVPPVDRTETDWLGEQISVFHADAQTYSEATG